MFSELLCLTFRATVLTHNTENEGKIRSAAQGQKSGIGKAKDLKKKKSGALQEWDQKLDENKTSLTVQLNDECNCKVTADTYL